jgi:ribose/xylose/arabinose/galactoside ABC-type transport system permease subunit
VTTGVAAPGATVAPVPPAPRARFFRFSNIGAVYVLLASIVVFSLLAPDTFPTAQTAKSILNQYAVTGLFAMALVVPLASGLFDLSIASQASLASVLVAILVAKHGVPIPLAIVIVIAAGQVVGLANSFVVIKLRIDSFIGTLATSAVLSAIAVGVSGNKTITGAAISGSFARNIAERNLSGVTIPVLYLVVAALAVAWVLERTATGRHWYAVGFDAEAARLAGIRTTTLQLAALQVSALLASIAGITLTARVSSGTPGAGDAYLLPAFAAAFLGATQFRNGRFNTWGTALAVFLIGTGDFGLTLAHAPQWAPKVFDGLVLIAAVGLTNIERGQLRLPSLPWRRPPPDDVAPAATAPADDHHDGVPV